MKRFTRTVTGKVTLFVLFNLLAALLAVCLGGAVFAWEEEIYYISEKAYIAANNGLSDYGRAVIHYLYLFRIWLYPIGILSAIGCLAIYITLLSAAGKNEEGELTPGHFFSVPFDLTVAAAITVGIGGLQIADDASYPFDLIVGLAALLYGLNAFLGLSMDFASRVKQHALIRNTLIYKIFSLLRRLCRWLWSLLRSIPLVWRTAAVVGGICLIELIAIAETFYVSDFAGFWVVEKLILLPLIFYAAISLRRLEKAGEALAAGDLSFRTDTKALFWDFRRHADNLNSISGGMAAAVEERLRSERMKTELITNVSHDIKTPLTSIINYASLIGTEECDNANIKEYSDVLLRQSEKLKRLIDDLVEASKASSGNLEVIPEPCDARIFLTQAAGEFEDRLRQAGLTIVTRLPEENLRIMADPRRMWRIFDNLMNNICKYSQEGTRVYLSLEKIGEEAVITFRNTSREELNVSADELMERFVRGDSSRHTEGNGLGLSIARSFTELQGGSMELTVDGDLFKVTLRFPAI